MREQSNLIVLREQIRRIERHYAPAAKAQFCATGLPGPDAHLGGGLLRGALHEFFDTSGYAAQSTRFIASILGRHPGPVLWIGTQLSSLYAMGLSQHGLNPERVICIEAEEAVLPSICEDALREPHFAATVIESPRLFHLTASRRFQLGVEQGGGLGILLYHCALPDAAKQPPTTSTTRWLITPEAPRTENTPHPAAGPGGTATASQMPWRLDLQRHRGGRPHQWSLSPFELPDPIIHDTAHPSRVVSTLAH